MASSAVLEQRTDIQVAGATWVSEGFEFSLDDFQAVITTKSRTPQPLRDMYARLAREYDAEPAVRTRSGGLPGELTTL